MKRRDFLNWAVAGAGVSLLAPGPFGSRDCDFRFAHVTDTHIQPELRAEEGCRRCFEQVRRMEPDFAIMGGDLVFDVNETPLPRARSLYRLYAEALKVLELPAHNVVGNHDVYGLANLSGARPNDPHYGKKMYQDRFGELHYSFLHKGWRFIVLDSIRIRHPSGRSEGGYWGEIDPDQMQWLEGVLDQTGPRTPVVVATHIPVFTAFMMYATSTTQSAPDTVVLRNGNELWQLLSRCNVKLVLQGHTHISESIQYNDTLFVTSGAVCGNWWKGERMGTREGYGLFTVRGEEVSWEYHSYGFEAGG